MNLSLLIVVAVIIITGIIILLLFKKRRKGSVDVYGTYDSYQNSTILYDQNSQNSENDRDHTGGGTFSGAGASGSWDESAPEASGTIQPFDDSSSSASDSSYDSSSDSGSSGDSGSSSSDSSSSD